jgi:hypothetical protein
VLKRIFSERIPKYLGFMKNPHLPKLGFFFKGFPEDVRFRTHTVPESLELVRGTLYEAWYRAVKLSPHMAEAIDVGNWRSKAQQDNFNCFGDLRGTTFDVWWVNVGYEIFKEPVGFKRIGIKESEQSTADQTLTLEVPLTVSPATLKAQFDQLLRDKHPHYARFDRWKFSEAQRKLRTSKLTSQSLNLYLDVYECWVQMKSQELGVHLYQVGEHMKLNPRYIVSRNDFPEEIKDKHLQMSLTVTEYLGKAKNLIAHASEGVFPCTDDHEWIDRAERSANWRKRMD